MLNEVEYKENVLKVIYRDQKDPFLREHINSHLNQQLEFSNLAGKLEDDWNSDVKKIDEEPKDLEVFRFSNETAWSSPEVLIVYGIILIIMGFGFLIFYCKGKSQESIKVPAKTKAAEEIPIQGSAGGTHHIIVQ